MHIANAALSEEWVVPETEVSILVTRGGDICLFLGLCKYYMRVSCWGATWDSPLKKQLENWWQENCSEISSIKNSALTITSQKQRETKPVWFSTSLSCHSSTHLKESKFYRISSIQCIMNYCSLWGLKLFFFSALLQCLLWSQFQAGLFTPRQRSERSEGVQRYRLAISFPVTGGILECFCQAKGCVHLPEKFLMCMFQDKAKCKLHWKSSF